MTQLFYVIGGWIGLLGRGSVLLQVLVAVGLLLAYRAWRFRGRGSASLWRPVLAKAVLVGLFALASLLLPQLGLPGGLLALFAQLTAIWTALAALRVLLRRIVPPEAVDSYWQRAVLPLFLVLVVVGLVHRLDGLEEISKVPLLKLFDQHLNLANLLLLLGLPYFLVVLSELPVVLLGEVMGRLMGMGTGNRKALELIVRYLLIGVGGIWLADRIGLNGTAIAAIAGGLSVGLGFGIKEVFSNFVSGLWLLFEGSVHPGDVLILEGDTCQVRKLGLRATTLWRDRDNAELVVPNQTFFTATATTYTGSDDRRRGQVLIGAGYQHDPELVIAVLEEVARAHPRVMADPAPKAFLLDYGSSSIDYALRFWMADPMTNLGISSELRRAIWHAFKQHDIEIPFPQRVVHQAR
jgi:small-conductance mechanosensitive channel